MTKERIITKTKLKWDRNKGASENSYDKDYKDYSAIATITLKMVFWDGKSWLYP